MTKASRRDFLRLGLAAGAGSLAPSWLARKAHATTPFSRGPLILDGSRVRPVMISSRNGQSALARGIEVFRD